MSFKDVIGQESAIAFLRASFKAARLGHAYLFLGPRGVGKEKAALAFARLLLCEGPSGEEPCLQCPSCRKAGEGNHPDLQWVRPQGQGIKIDAIRAVCRRLTLKGFESSRKVLIIAEAHRLNEESSNALLKTLEEPSEGTVLILISENLESMLATIVSRCQKVVFLPLKGEVLRVLLEQEFHLTKREASFLSFFCEGSLGRALEYHRDGVFAQKNEMIKRLLHSGFSADAFDLLDIKERAQRDSALEETLRLLASWFRDLLLAKTAPAQAVFIHEDRRQDILHQSSRLSFADIQRYLEVIAEASTDAGYNANPKISFSHLRAQLWK